MADLTPDQASAKAIINGFLGAYGLSSLANTVWNWYLGGSPVEQIMLDIRSTPEYKTRFPAMDKLAQQGMALTEQQYIDYERTVGEIMHGAGIPSGFYDQPNDFTQLLLHQVSPAEVQDRVKLAAQAVYQSDATTRAELQRIYGIDSGHLTAYWLDPDRAQPLLAQQFLSSQIAADSARSSYGELSRQQAEQVAQWGTTEADATKGFGQLVQERQLFNPLPGQQGPAFDRTAQLAAMFGGAATTQEAIEQVARSRLAEFKGGGQFATDKEGVTGIGPSKF